ncbi:hydroxymethylglutaryl-CoA lyase [Mesorhizobium sp. L-8-10]|uniref:hydroxymethylglutaryl-CoA lyase n=1 Tax=Mesorhizobium sp. L-8-10 TaxID=2744523 RepID=UPI0019266D61|nr:hydroxymethylglutaryl-CoA lyase [Mesorhizobium sp. L-8-10]BCH28543.1 hydroxymethylglutaryl-CoA lyase [Mesorhizobium sp. L-8-10]
MSRLGTAYPPDRVSLREVGLRDGLQLVKSWPTTEEKRDWLVREHAAGARHFEVGSFLPASRMPQFADVRAMIEAVGTLDGARSAALALNERGAADALETQVDEIVCVISATEEHSQANMRRSRDDAIGLVRSVARMRDERGHGALINAGIAMAFGCSIAGRVEPDEVLRLAEACMSAGADVIGIADTVGFAGPRQVTRLASGMRVLVGDGGFIIHLHDTRGMGIANASAALDAGCRILDGSLGGLGGCPFAPGATGNVVFEDLVYLCETKGFATGIDLPALAAVRSVAEKAMPRESFFGGIARAGPPATLDWRA